MILTSFHITVEPIIYNVQSTMLIVMQRQTLLYIHYEYTFAYYRLIYFYSAHDATISA